MRGLGPEGIAGALLAVLALASPSPAAELVAIRVGVHPGFTRVVFELDAVAGYSIGGPASEPGVDELVIELAAHGPRRVVTSTSELIESVRTEPSATGSIARIRLRGSGTLKVSEMRLVDPPRIVLDLRPKSAEMAPPQLPPAQPLPPVESGPPRAPAPADGPGSDARLAELERRVAELEARLARAEGERERLGAELASRETELRLQREAIARAQRALRGLAPAGDAPGALAGPTPP